MFSNRFTYECMYIGFVAVFLTRSHSIDHTILTPGDPLPQSGVGITGIDHHAQFTPPVTNVRCRNLLKIPSEQSKQISFST